MRKANCSSCGNDFPSAQMRLIEDQTYCGQCAEKKAASSMQGLGYAIIDPTVCAKCSTDWGNNELPTVGGLPYCNKCREQLYKYPIPQWLKAGLAVALVLLVVALAHGAKYFRLARDLYRGEAQIASKKYTAAVQSLTPVAKAAPDCEKCLLLAAKAHLLTGRPDLAWAVVKKHNDGHFEITDEEKDVESLFARFTTASNELETAKKQYDNHQEEEALKSVQRAEADYPEWDFPHQESRSLRIDMAFKRRDYDTFLLVAEEVYKAEPTSSQTAAQLASALACKYAVTGDPNYFDQSHKYLSEAGSLAKDKEAQNEFQEYSERIEHRLKTREIIDKPEYDRRFRPTEVAKEVKQ